MASGLVMAGARAGRPRPQEVDRHVGARLRERRIALGLTQQELAGLAGITYQQLHKYEKGANRITAGRLYVFAWALEAEPGHFFEGLGGEPARPGPGERQRLELARSLAALSPRQRAALGDLARALAGTGQEPGGPAVS